MSGNAGEGRARAARRGLLGVALAVLLGAGCTGDTRNLQGITAESCMLCHNASTRNDYSGPGIENPHPFGTASNLLCTTCHGGNGAGTDKSSSHVPPPPQIGNSQNLLNNRRAYFNRLTLAGIDKFPDYTVAGTTYSALDYLQFINPGDLRVVTDGRACGVCHSGHAEVVAQSPLATSTGIFSGATYAIGVENAVPESQGLYQDTAADLGFRDVTDTSFPGSPETGDVTRLLEFPVHSYHGQNAPDQIFQNPAYDAAQLLDDRNPDNSAITGSPLSHLFQEQVAFTCGDCHLGSAGANNRYGDFRSSGCTACHMPYSQDGRSRSNDPNVNKLEPLDPDDIEAPERSHVRSHRIASVSRMLPSGVQVPGIDDYTCAGCHQGSNRTVMQYWGIRLDQNEDLRRNVQYPANPIDFEDTRDDARLFDPVVGNRTFNGRDDDQYILFEDYDGDGRDDTPPDVHYEAGMGCIDCHGSHDLHGGDPSDPAGASIVSRMEQAVAIRCESCHGGIEAYAATVQGTAHDGQVAQLAVDAAGNPLRHVVREADGHFYLYSKLTGARHFVPQTHDLVASNGRTHPDTGQPLYSAKASYAMGRIDGNPMSGIGPQQTGGTSIGFSHTDDMDCASCHSAWTNTCMGCHLEGEYTNNNDNFNNIVGERSVFRERNADFVYQSPVFFQLGIDATGKITQTSANTKTFFRWRDRQGVFSQVYTFSDRNGGGTNPARPFPSMSHNAMMAHSIRGRVDANDEGPRYCVACHLTESGLATYGGQYASFRSAMTTGNYGSLDFNLLRTHFGLNTGNQLDSPLWVHMVAGLGTGLFLFDDQGAPVNPLDNDPNRKGAGGQAPAATYDPARVRLNLDRVVEPSGVSNGSSNHAFLDPAEGPALRTGAADPLLSGPLGTNLIQRLSDPSAGIVLDSWLDANGQPRGNAAGFLNP